MAWSRPQPTHGNPIVRTGLPYFWVTHIAKLLGGDQCLWSAWFKSRHMFAKYEENGEQLAEWNREHSRMMRDRVQELRDCGWKVATEEQNSFKVEGDTAVVAGKPDIIATLGPNVLIVDGKTGRQRDSDVWQVLLYLWSIPRSRPDIKGKLAGEIHYQKGDQRIPVRLVDLTPERVDDIVTMVKVVGASDAPEKSPSRWECSRCQIDPKDCPERFSEARQQERPSVSAGF